MAKAKKRGRPKGSKNKTKTKRKAYKRKRRTKKADAYDLRILKAQDMDTLITLATKVSTAIKANKVKTLADLKKQEAVIAAKIKALS